MKLDKSITLVLLATYLLALTIGVFVLYHSGAYNAGFSGADESSHFLNGFFINEYLGSHLTTNPLSYAVKYYIHYPKLSIGHWPPAYYGFLGLIFFLLPATACSAFIVNLFVSALPVLFVAGILLCIGGKRLAFIGAFVYSLCPLVLEGYSFFMLDQILSAFVAATVCTWVLYVRTQTWIRALSFAALFTVTVLIKGNGWLLIFVPPYYLVLTNSWSVLRAPALYVAFAFAVLVVVPWYWLTSNIAADGFNYHVGISYAILALTENLRTAAGNLTWLFIPLTMAGFVSLRRMRIEQPLPCQIATGCASVILATLTLQSLVPVDIVDRYMAPAMPAIIILSLAGINGILLAKHRIAPLFAFAAVAMMVAPGFLFLLNIEPKSDLQAKTVATTIISNKKPHIYLIDGTAGAEGGYIAELASKDRPLQNYVLRSSKIFADSNFMGSDYHLKYSTKDEVLAEINRLGVSHIVVVRLNGKYAFPHSRQLVDAIELPYSNYRKVLSVFHKGRFGITDVYQSVTEAVPNFEAVNALGTPSKTRVITTNPK